MITNELGSPLPLLNIDPSRQPVLASHRSGWRWAMEALEPLHSPGGVLFDSFLERTFCWFKHQELHYRRIPYREPWVGVLHNPPGVPVWHDYQNSPQELIRSYPFQQSLEYCRGIFVLSQYLKDWLSNQVNIPITVLTHPSDADVPQFDFDRYLQNNPRQTVQVGWWLRKLTSIYRLPVNSMIRILLQVEHDYFTQVLSREQQIFPVPWKEKLRVNHVEFLENAHYDELLTESLVFVDLFDSSANNTVIECLMRSTPLLINPLPAVREYLGDDYPFYFNNLAEAAEKAKDEDLILATHKYLSHLNKARFSASHFRHQLVTSEIYQNLASVDRQSLSKTLPSRPILNSRVRDSLWSDVESNISISRSALGQVTVDHVEIKLADLNLSDQLSRQSTIALRGKTVTEAIEAIGNGIQEQLDISDPLLREAAANCLEKALRQMG